MASVINADGATVIGTIEQIAEFLRRLRGVLNLDRANFVILAAPLTRGDLKTAIEAMPRRKGTGNREQA